MRLVHRARADLTSRHIARVVERPVSWDAASGFEANRSIRDSGSDRRRHRQLRRERDGVWDNVGTQHLANLRVTLLGRIESGDQLPDPSVLRLETGDLILETGNPRRRTKDREVEARGENHAGTDNSTEQRQGAEDPDRNPDRA